MYIFVVWHRLHLNNQPALHLRHYYVNIGKLLAVFFSQQDNYYISYLGKRDVFGLMLKSGLAGLFRQSATVSSSTRWWKLFYWDSLSVDSPTHFKRERL